MFFAAVVTIIFLLWLLQRPFYWKGRNIKYMTPWPLVGNFGKSFVVGRINILQYLYSLYPHERIFGFHAFFKPALMIRDPSLTVNIFIKDFEHFTDNTFGSDSPYDVIGKNLLFLRGEQWKDLRSKITPYFTPSKIKAMLLPAFDVTMTKVGTNMDELCNTGEPCNLQKVLVNVSNDIITQALFGIESDVFQNDSRFTPLANLIFSPKTNMMFLVKNFSLRLFKFLRLQSIDADAAYFVKELVSQLINYRKNQNIKGHDFVQAMIDIMDQFGPKNTPIGKSEYYSDGTTVLKFDFEEMFLQALILFIGGVESTGTTMTWVFYELVRRPEMQDRCREEIKKVVTTNGHLTLEELKELPYLNGAIKEALRMYPPFPILARSCTKRYHFEEFNLTVQPGTLVMYPMLGVQRDPKHFPDPDTFQPERFIGDEAKTNLVATFGLGPRLCIGKSFATYEMLLVTSQLLLKYKFALNAKTKIPLMAERHLPINTPSTPLWIDVTRAQ